KRKAPKLCPLTYLPPIMNLVYKNALNLYHFGENLKATERLKKVDEPTSVEQASDVLLEVTKSSLLAMEAMFANFWARLEERSAASACRPQESGRQKTHGPLRVKLSTMLQSLSSCKPLGQGLNEG
ncbi:Hypothetical predicted protein, partial [Pelobates cultripes]